jgi:hypothetical protein
LSEQQQNCMLLSDLDKYKPFSSFLEIGRERGREREVLRQKHLTSVQKRSDCCRMVSLNKWRSWMVGQFRSRADDDYQGISWTIGKMNAIGVVWPFSTPHHAICLLQVSSLGLNSRPLVAIRLWSRWHKLDHWKNEHYCSSLTLLNASSCHMPFAGLIFRTELEAFKSQSDFDQGKVRFVWPDVQIEFYSHDVANRIMMEAIDPCISMYKCIFRT